MTGARSDRERWHAIMDALSDETAEMSDEAVLREFGAGADQDSNLVRSIIQASVGETGVTPYEATKAALDKDRNSALEPMLPETPERRRSLLELIMSGGHRWSDSATLAFRELNDPADFSDDEITGILEDLAELNDESDA